MAKVEIKGYLVKAFKPEVFENKKSEGQTTVQRIVIQEPSRKDDFGDPMGPDSLHEIRVMNRNLEKIPADVRKAFDDYPLMTSLDVDTKPKVKATCYLNGREVTKDDKTFYTTELSLADLQTL